MPRRRLHEAIRPGRWWTPVRPRQPSPPSIRENIVWGTARERRSLQRLLQIEIRRRLRGRVSRMRERAIMRRVITQWRQYMQNALNPLTPRVPMADPMFPPTQSQRSTYPRGSFYIRSSEAYPSNFSGYSWSD